jgi:murein L,D-transpeptidase YcbB/YkuD
MNLLRLAGALLVICALLTSCGGNNKSNSGFPFFSKSELEKHYPDFDEKILTDSVKAFFTGTSPHDEFYRKNNFAPVWTKDIFDSPALDTLISYLENSPTHGINPERFSFPQIKQLTDTIRTGNFANNMLGLYQHLVKLENMASKAFIDYNTGLRFGFTDPKKDFPKSYFIPTLLPDSTHYINVFAGLKEDPVKYIKESQPADSAYSKLQNTLSFYADKKDISFDPIPKKDKKSYQVNDTDPTVFPMIAKRLIITGELPETSNPDSLYASLTSDLLNAINTFRKQNSYPEDEEVGGPTIDALNRPLSYYHDKVKANLERMRWKKKNPGGNKFVEVNVAAFMLKAIEPRREPLLMNVCVGKAGNNQTPLLQSEIYYINLNPNWNVPPSILEKEIYWSVQKRPDYLQRNRMKLINKEGKEVDPSSVDWTSLNPKKMPFRVRQDPGAGNSLGRIKFMFDNPFSVYLHDTPSKSTFSARNRAVSHGCVRVQKPTDLSFFLLEKKDSVYLDRILISIDKSPESQEGKELFKKGQLKKLDNILHLSQRVPVFIDYFTSYVLPDGKVYFADDVYSFDNTILKQL